MGDTTAFVIMQVGSKGSLERKRADEIFDHIITPALEDVGIRPIRADQDPSPGAITPKFLSDLIDAKLIVADLTGRNPNVFYELGIAHSFAKPLICIADSASSLPFDAKDERVIEVGPYPESGLPVTQASQAKKSLAKSLEIVLGNEYVAPSPIRSLAGERSLRALEPENPIAAELAEVKQILEEIHKSRRRVQFVVPPDYQSDMRALRKFVEKSLEDHELCDLADLIDDATSKRHDAWVSELIDRYDDTNRPGQVAEDPWARAKPTQGDPWSSAPDDEPPF